jgi:hypothetical protein
MKFSWPSLEIAGKKIFDSGSTQLFTIPSIPALASGGLLTAPTLMVGGEGSYDEAVLPLNSSVFSSIGKGIAENGGSNGSLDTDRILERLDNLANAIGKMKIVMQANNRELAESVNEGNRLLDRARHSVATT